jgi:hypothetical protein
MLGVDAACPGARRTVLLTGGSNWEERKQDGTAFKSALPAGSKTGLPHLAALGVCRNARTSDLPERVITK